MKNNVYVFPCLLVFLDPSRLCPGRSQEWQKKHKKRPTSPKSEEVKIEQKHRKSCDPTLKALCVGFFSWRKKGEEATPYIKNFGSQIFICFGPCNSLASSFLSLVVWISYQLTWPHVAQVKRHSVSGLEHMFRTQIIIYRHCIISQNRISGIIWFCLSSFHSLPWICVSLLSCHCHRQGLFRYLTW